MEPGIFKNNYRHINAGRPLDDQTIDKTHKLSKNMIDLASQDDNWKEFVSKLPDEILQPIEESDINDVVRKTSVATLTETIQLMAKY